MNDIFCRNIVKKNCVTSFNNDPIFFFDDIWLFFGVRALDDLLCGHEQGVDVFETVELSLVDLLDDAPEMGRKV